MRKRGVALLLMFAGAMAVAMPSWGRGYGHHHGHSHARVGVYLGVPLGFGYSWYGAPPYYAYPSYSYPSPYYYQPPAVIRQETQVYIERSAPQASPAAEAYWHYCNNPQGYYPYVKECPGGWMRVTPTPPN